MNNPQNKKTRLLVRLMLAFIVLVMFLWVTFIAPELTRQGLPLYIKTSGGMLLVAAVTTAVLFAGVFALVLDNAQKRLLNISIYASLLPFLLFGSYLAYVGINFSVSGAAPVMSVVEWWWILAVLTCTVMDIVILVLLFKKDKK